MFGIYLYFILAVLGTVISDDDDLYFSKSPRDLSVITGNEVILECEVSPNFGVTYHWKLNGKKIVNTTRRFQLESSLHITRADRERDSGQFTCIAKRLFDGMSITSSAASLNIHWIEEPEVQLQSPESASFITAGKEVILRCHDEASGDVHYEWFRNADRMVKSDRLDIKKKRLHIKSVNPSDNGIYKCTAKNEAGLRTSEKNFALSVAGDQAAQIEVVPTNQLVKAGNNAIFDCVYKYADVIEWYFKETGPLESNERVKIHSNGSLQLNGVEKADEGLYNCVGIRGESAEVPQSYVAELKIAYINQFSTSTSFEPELRENSSHIVGENTYFQLTCLQPQSSPAAKKFWINSVGHTISDTGEVKVDDDGRLIIEKVRLENAGKYTCVAENIAGRTEISIDLIVTSKPRLLKEPESITVNENNKSVLDCVVESNSNEHTVIRWRKDGKIIKDNSENANQRVKVLKANGTLVISSTTADDRGEYICEVTTAGFEPVTSKPATISVIEILKFSPAPVNKKLELGTVARLHCKAQGTPPPTVHWTKVGEGEAPSSSLPSHVTDMNGTLHFGGVLTSDGGVYECTAINSQGRINVTVKIDVVVSPKFSILTKNSTEGVEGMSVFIDCIAEGDPKPTIQWDKNLKMNDFDKTRFTVMDNGSLFISEVHRDDENIYGCTAGSSAGLNRKEIHLIVHPKDGYLPPIENEGSTVTKAVLITMSVAAAYIILVVGLMVWCRFRRRSRKLPITDGVKTENGDVEHTELKETTANGHTTVAGPSASAGPVVTSSPQKTNANGIDTVKEGQRSDGAETTHSQSSSHSKKSKSSYDKIALSRSHLKENKLIGRGEFGDVFSARLPRSSLLHPEKRNSTGSDDKELYVMVKSLAQTKDENSLTEFKRELDMFTKLSHENVTKLYGLCRDEEPHYMILEYTDWGDLKHFLVATQTPKSPPLTPLQSVAVIHQIARAMDALSAARLLHRDLAARNCLITSKLLIKVSMARLSRDPYSQEYCKHANQVIPLRWMPHEAVYEDDHSARTDVYAFGVLMWEVFQQGELPFPKLNDTSVLARLREGTLEWKYHKDTPEALLTLQESCLDTLPQNRPTFSHLVKEIETILKSM